MHPDSTREQFEQIYEQYFDSIYRFVARRVRGEADVQDLVSETFLKIYQHLPAFHPKHEGALRGWLYTIAKNEVYQYFRKQKHVSHTPLEELPEIASTEHIPDLFESEQVSTIVRGLLEKVEAEDREIILLKYFDELANTEIAEVLQITANHVGVRLHRGLQKFKKVL